MNILFINKLKSKFIQDDFKILSINHKVTHIDPIFLISKKIFNIFKYIKIAKQNDIIYSWWLTSYFAVILGLLSKRKVVLIAGGFDCMKLPKIKYGAFMSWKTKLIVNFNVLFASHVIFVSKTLKNQFQKNCKIKQKLSVINLGIDNKEWYSIKNLKNHFILLYKFHFVRFKKSSRFY
jgi:hypothetical protein